MLTIWSGSKRGNPTSGKYKFQVLWEIDTLAAVNARDVGRKFFFAFLSFVYFIDVLLNVFCTVCYFFLIWYATQYLFFT